MTPQVLPQALAQVSTSDFSHLSLPSWFHKFRDGQPEAIVEIIEHFRSGIPFVFLSASVGCLAGDTRISVNRAGKQFYVSLKNLVHKFNGGAPHGGMKWNPSIPTMVQRAVTGTQHGAVLRLVPLVRAVESGVKETFTLTTESGKSIRATADHRFALHGGVMVPLSGLVVGDEILVDGGKGKKATATAKPYYPRTSGVVNHPAVRIRPYIQPTHRLVIEAEKNGLPLDWYIAILRDRNADTSSLFFLDGSDAVHHLNGDTRDFSRDNLEVVSHQEHGRLHGLSGAWENVQNRVIAERITSVELYGEEETFDLTVADDPHNFVANRFIVENSGKTLVAEAVRQVMFNPVPQVSPQASSQESLSSDCCLDPVHGWRGDDGCCGHVPEESSVDRGRHRTVYACSTLSLQEQFLKDFDHAYLMMGRGNYPTELVPDQFPKRSCADCTRTLTTPCTWCSGSMSCPYLVQKRAALSSELVVANMAYMATEPNTSRPGFSGLDLLVTDEVDLLSRVLLDQVEIYLSERRRSELGIDPPEFSSKPEAWQEWLESEAIPKTTTALRRLPKNPDTLQEMKERRSLDALVNRLLRVDLSEGWVYDGCSVRCLSTPSQRGKHVHQIRFRPIKVAAHAQDLYFRHARNHLCMSATIISADQLADEFGMPEGSYATVEMDSTFPPRRFPIKVRPVANMVYTPREYAGEEVPESVRRQRVQAERGNLAEEIKRIMTDHPNDRILVHTVSYEVTQYLKEVLTSPRVVSYDSARGREQALRRFRSNKAAVLLAPSLDRGVDLPDDLARVIVVCKMAFPYLGDSRVSKRMHSPGGNQWYSIEAVRSLAQMVGRGARHERDWCTCVSPETLVLTGDLEWIPVGKLVVGDTLLAFDEKTTRLAPRKWHHAQVLAIKTSPLPRMRIALEDGTQLYATPDHMWLSKWGQARDDSWVRTDRLRSGHHLNRYVHPWSSLNSRDVGWLAGFVDGEGTLTLSQGSKHRNVTGIVLPQNEGPLLNEAIRVVEGLGFDYGLRLAYQKGSTNPSDPKRNHNHYHLSIKGGFVEHLRFLGQVRPLRLLKKFQSGQRMMTTEYVRVDSVESIEDGPMVTMETSTGTFIAEGFGAHNCFILDQQFVSNLWPKSKHLFPSWFRARIDWYDRWGSPETE